MDYGGLFEITATVPLTGLVWFSLVWFGLNLKMPCLVEPVSAQSAGDIWRLRFRLLTLGSGRTSGSIIYSGYIRDGRSNLLMKSINPPLKKTIKMGKNCYKNQLQSKSNAIQTFGIEAQLSVKLNCNQIRKRQTYFAFMWTFFRQEFFDSIFKLC